MHMATDKKNDQAMRERIIALLESQPLAVLATQRDGQPYSSLMAFAYLDDLSEFVVATSNSTRKHQNISEDARVSLLVDNRSNSEEDFHAAAALTILGIARPVEDHQRGKYQQLYLKRHPALEKFISGPSVTIFRIEIHHYLLVSRFQNVIEYHIKDEVDLFS
jgi:nitroimidazol reductase NimA-like FMN-containing flavoprotein (pyridoxamine 5'-phosphate oxidase superfamily)